MAIAISNTSATVFNPAILSSAASASTSTVDTSTSDQEALLEAELAIYTQELAEASSGNGSTTPGALNAQQLQQQITSIEQQLNQLGATSSSSSSISASVGNFINTFI